jgi:hypothetical protein
MRLVCDTITGFTGNPILKKLLFLSYQPFGIDQKLKWPPIRIIGRNLLNSNTAEKAVITSSPWILQTNDFVTQ